MAEPSTRVRHTTCNRDCPDACRIEAEVQGVGAEERVVKLRGAADHPMTQGFLCHRTDQFLHRQYDPQRVLTPLRRHGDEHVAISWDEALSVAAERLATIRAESGPASIFHYRSGGTLGMVTAAASDLFFEQFGPVTVKRGDICSGAGEAAQECDFGVSDSSKVESLSESRHILVWGKNVHTSSPHTLPHLKRARARGAKLVSIDPVFHQTARMCDVHVQPRPGGDLALAMAVARILFETDRVTTHSAARCLGLEDFRSLAFDRSVAAWCTRADVSPDVPHDLADRLSDGPTSILVGWGMGRRWAGGATVRALDALAALSANLGVVGGGASFYFKRNGAFRKLTRGIEVAPRTICEPMFGPEILAATEPPIRALWVTAGNPVAMLPESDTVAKAVRSCDFVVVVDNWMSDTARLADLVLPVTTLLESDDIVGAYGHHYLGVAKPVIAAPPEVKSDLAIFQALASRLGMTDYLQGDAAQIKEQLLGERLRENGYGLDEITTGLVQNPSAKPALFDDGTFPTTSGKVQLMTELPDRPANVPVPDDSYPLSLLSLSSPKSQSSQWAKAQPPDYLEATVHPDVAGPLAEGALASLCSRRTRLTVRLKLDARQRRDVVIVPKGGHYHNRTAANLLITARTTDLGEGGALYDETVRLEALSEHEGSTSS